MVRETARFAASAPHYDRFMGRYALTLAPAFADAAGVTLGTRVPDVGCGPGGLTSELSRRTAAETSRRSTRRRSLSRLAGTATPRPTSAREWPSSCPGQARNSMQPSPPSSSVSCTIPTGAFAQMARVTRPGGTVAACMWDIAGGGGMVMLTVSGTPLGNSHRAWPASGSCRAPPKAIWSRGSIAPAWNGWSAAP